MVHLQKHLGLMMQKRCPDPPHRHRTPDPPRRSRTPSRNAIVLTPAPRGLDPEFIPTPDADDTWGNWKDKQPDDQQPDDRRPHSPPGPPPSISAFAPLGSVSDRVATGDSDESEQDEHFSIATYVPGDSDIVEMKAAAIDPERVQFRFDQLLSVFLEFL